jgi:hypothetical protein
VEHVEAGGQTAQLEAASGGSVAGSRAAAGLEESLWLCPIEDRRQLDSSREGMLEGFSLGSYLPLVDHTGRLFRSGKTALSADVASIFDRLGRSSSLSVVRGQLSVARKGVAGDRCLQVPIRVHVVSDAASAIIALQPTID